jgi:hypothetical protein
VVVDGQRQRELVRYRNLQHLFVVVERAAEDLDRRVAQDLRLLAGEIVPPFEWRQLGPVQDLVGPGPADAGDHPLVSKQAVQRPGVLEQWAELGRVRPRLGSQRGDGFLGVERLSSKQLRPARLPGAELPEPELPAVG